MEELIDRALESYVAREAPPGIEGRILARTREPRKARWAAWAAIAVAAGLVIGMLNWPRPANVELPNLAAPSGPAESLSYPGVRQIAQAKAPVSHRRPLRKGRVFPTPEPVLVAEIELARLLASKPEIANALTAEPAPMEPITIEPISVKAIDED